jgi:hypothetical protein
LIIIYIMWTQVVMLFLNSTRSPWLDKIIA